MRKAYALTVFLTIALAGMALPAHAADSGEIPYDVVEFASTQALRDVVEASRGAVIIGEELPIELRAVAGATRLGHIHAVNAFTQEYRLEGEAPAPVTPNGTWVTAVLAGDTPVATALISHNAKGNLEVAEVAHHAELAAALIQVVPGSIVVYDSPAAAWFVLDSSTLTTLYTPAGKARYSLAEYGGLLAEHSRTVAAAAVDPADPLVGGNGYLVTGAIVYPLWSTAGAILAGCAALLLGWRARGRRCHASERSVAT